MSGTGSGGAQEATGGTAPAGQEPTGQQGQNGENGGQEPTGNATGTEGQQAQALTMEQVLESIQDPNMKAYLEKLDRDAKEARQEAGNYRTKYQTAQQERDTLARQNETDADRVAREQQEANDERERLRQENRDLKVGTALSTAATTAGAFNAKTVANLVNAQVELDDDGQPTNIPALLAELKRTDPYLFKRDSADAGAGGGNGAGSGAQPVGMNDFIRGTARAGR